GMPVSGPPPPLASMASARRAAASACSGSTEMNALSVVSRASMAARLACVSSTLETRRARNAAASSTIVAARIGSVAWLVTDSLDDLGHEIEPALDGGRHGLEARMLVALRCFVLAQRRGDILRVRHGHDAGGVDRLQLVDHAEDALELRAHGLHLHVIELEACKVREAADVGGGDGHDRVMIGGRFALEERPRRLPRRQTR